MLKPLQHLEITYLAVMWSCLYSYRFYLSSLMFEGVPVNLLLCCLKEISCKSLLAYNYSVRELKNIGHSRQYLCLLFIEG